MNIFVIHSGKDYQQVALRIQNLKKKNYNLNALALENGNMFWRIEALEKIKKSQMVVFYIGDSSHESPYIAWELRQAIKYGKPIYTIKLNEQNQNHPALITKDRFSGEEIRNDISVDEHGLLKVIQNYQSGDYALFNESPDQLDKTLLLEQYKVFLRTSEDLVSRRQNISSFYITIHSVLIAFFSALFAFELSDKYRMMIGALFCLVGIILSFSWINILIAYGNLNGSKMKIISCMEKQLPASLYDAEWAALSDKLNKKKYVSFTDNEKNIPKIFLLLYSVVLLGIIVSVLISHAVAI